MLDAQHAIEHTNTDVVMTPSIVGETCIDAVALKLARQDALETARALENLVEGMQAVKRILERPFEETSQADDAKLVSELSKKLFGVLGSDLTGLLNAAQMTKCHAKLCVEGTDGVLQDLHLARDVAQKAKSRADRAERIGYRLKKEKQLLVREVRALRGDRLVLTKEINSIRKMAKRSKQLDAWRVLRKAMAVHESVLSNKTFTSGFGRVDPPGTVTKTTDTTDRARKKNSMNSNNAHKETDVTPASPTSNKENTYSPRTENPNSEPVENIIYPVLKTVRHSNKSPEFISATTSTTGSIPNSRSTPTKQAGAKPVTSTSRSKSVSESPPQTSLPTNSTPRSSTFKNTFKSTSKGFGNSLCSGLGRFKNVFQEASDQMRHPENNKSDQQQNEQKLSLTRNIQKETFTSERNTNGKHNRCTSKNSSAVSVTSTKSDATKITESCSFDSDHLVNSSEINSSLNIDTTMTICGDDEMSNDLVFQISIDEGSSFLNSSHHHNECSSPCSRLLITPEPLPVHEVAQSSNKASTELLNPTILRTLIIPSDNNGNHGLTSSSNAVKPRPRSSPLGQ